MHIKAFAFIYLSFIIFKDSNAQGDIDHLSWNEFKKRFNKKYESLAEDNFRKSIFEKNKNMIHRHNKRFFDGDSSYSLALNEFSDMTNEEIESNKLMIPLSLNAKNFERIKFDLPKDRFLINEKTPESIDWSSYGAVPEIKSQGRCYSCYCFPVVAAVESHNFIRTQNLTELSEQEIIDCSDFYGNSGCKGGNPISTYKYILEKGILPSKKYSYRGFDQPCKRVNRSTAVRIEGYEFIPAMDENALKAIVGKYGPVAAFINNPKPLLSFYRDGIFDEPSCNTNNLSHGVLITGYGYSSTYKKEYWIVRNSWGTSWGINGYMYLARNKNLCGIATHASYPIMA